MSGINTNGRLDGGSPPNRGAVRRQIAALSVGLAVGIAARTLLPGHTHLSVWVCAALGGVGGWGSNRLGTTWRLYGASEWPPYLMSAVGAVLVLLVTGMAY